MARREYSDKMYTAPSYDTWERYGELYVKSGRPYSMIKCKCWKCGGKGTYAWFGVCFACNGSGWTTKEVRLYTEEERIQVERNNDRNNEKKKLDAYQKKMDRIAHARENAYEKQGFNADGITYMAVGNTYAVKDELKAAGFKFSQSMNWHGPKVIELEDIEFIALEFDNIFEITEDGYHMMKESAEEYIESKKYENVDSSSEFIGEIKERVRDILVEVISETSFEGYYGTTYVYKFEDENKNVITWFASKKQDVEEGDKIYLTGTIKDHQLYKGIKQTVLTRCKIIK